MTVAENLSFPLEVRKISKPDIKEKVQKALDMVELGNFGTRFPAQLSGGQQQSIVLKYHSNFSFIGRYFTYWFSI